MADQLSKSRETSVDRVAWELCKAIHGRKDCFPYPQEKCAPCIMVAAKAIEVLAVAVPQRAA
jgi:hypothetical protein